MTVKGPAILLLLILTITSCNPDSVRKPDGQLLLSDEKLVSVLTDTYLAGGVLDVPDIRNTWGKRDSIQNYSDILASKGCTKEQLDATMYYYFASKPKKMAKIYDRVIANLMEIEAGIKKSPPPESSNAKKNLWTGKTSYMLPDDFTKDPIWFDIPVDSSGTYVLKADIQVYADDKSLEPRITVFFSSRNESGVEVEDRWDEVKLEKNGKFQKVEMRKFLLPSGETHIKGWLLNHSSQKGIWEKHARIRNISLTLEREEVSQE